MRVLAIRGRNLASLAGDFSVDFEAEPLAEAGIFAITGPTGAGKSTLLDAVCLALFNEIPRLAGAPSGARITVEGHDDGITAGDTRLILRHGAGEGFAEVDFAAADGARYRATWSVQRARQSPTGRLQNVQQTFQRLDTGEILGGTRTETLAAIKQAVGLSAEQFGRAVLLAQGDFEAFIRARPDERAALLERLTGSEIYARLGRKAFEKAQELRRGLDALRSAIASQNGLDEEQRAQAEADLALARTHEDETAGQFAALDAGRQWEERSALLAQELARAVGDEAGSKADWDAAAPRREALVRDRKAMALVPLITARETAAAAIATTQGRIEGGAAELAAASAQEALARQDEEAAQAAVAQARAAAESAASDLAKARALDLRIADAAGRVAEADAATGEHAEALDIAREADVRAAEACETTQALLADHLAWLEAHAALAPLVSRKDELQEVLALHARDSARLAEIETKAQQAEQQRLGALAAWSGACEALEVATAAHGVAAAALAAVETQMPDAARLGEITRLRDDLRSLGVALTEQQRAGEAAAGINAALALARTRLADAEAGARAATEEDAALALLEPALIARRDEAARACALAAAAADQAAQALREQLVDGEPCPVCGATEHRLSALDAVLGEQLTGHRARLFELETELAGHAARRNAIAADLRVTGARAEGLAEDIGSLKTQLGDTAAHAERLAATIATAAAALGLPGETAALAPAHADRLRRADDDLAGLNSAQVQFDAVHKGEQSARAEVDGARMRHTAAQEALAHRTHALEDLARERLTLEQSARQGAATLDATLGPLMEWRTHADQGDWLTRNLADWRSHDAGRTASEHALIALRDARQEAANVLSASAARASASADAALVERKAHEALAAERAAVLGGEAVEAVEARINGALAAAGAALAAATAARTSADKAVVALRTRLDEDHARKAEQQASLTQASESFIAALQIAGLAEEGVQRMAQTGQAALDAESEALAELDSTLAQRRAVLAKCHGDVARHEASEPPGLRGPELATAIAEADQARTDAAAIRSEIEVRLRMDDAVRAKTASLRAELTRAEADADVWLRLNDLIGDAEGRKFRRFAQGLTLDRLLEHANVRLAELKPRFTLERASGGDMLIQVIDNDMGGDVRGLHNLSGGERFLVSLALALGLAEMSTTKGVRIESLFIDEGFGALDPKSLGDAIAVLEHLHATGRRVGVISHVEDLKERIPVKVEVVPEAPGRSTVAVTVG